MNRIVGIVVLSFICLFFVFQTQSVSAQTTTNNFALRINAGGVENNYNGNTFVGDNLFNTGSTLDRPQTGLPEPFQTFRYSRSQEMSYDIPLEDGEYKVNLYFAELWFGATGGGSGGVGSRVFDVSLEGQLAEDNLDVFAEVGPDNLLMRSYTVTVTGEVLNIDFNSTDASGGERHPIINAIEILGNDIQTPQITVESVTNLSNEINEAISFGVSASGGDSNTPFSYAISGQPSGVDINEATGLITGTIDPNAALGGSNGDGIHNVTVAVSKSGHTDASTTFEWTITDATCEWNGLSDAAINRFEAISQKIGDKLYVFGGFTYGVKVVPETEIYDTTNDTWTTGASLPIPVTHTAVVAVGTDIWIIGGFAGDNPGVATNAVQIYDTLTDSWSVGPALPNPVGSSAAALNGNKIFYVGGLQPDRQSNVADHLVLDLTNIGGGWTLVAPMPNPRNHHSYISVNGIIYAIGGQFGHDGPKQDTKLVHAYNPNTDAWTQMTDLARPRSHFKAATTIHNGKIIIVGGVDNGPLVNDISQYDPQLNTWTELCKLPGEGLEEGAAQAFGDRLILSGGRPVRDANVMLKETRWMQLEPNTSQPPVVNAGQDQSIDLPTNAVVINGSGSDPDGGAVTYQWTQQNGPATSLLTNTTTNTLTASNLVEGTYIFRLTVTDDENETDFDEVSITVNEEPVVPDFALRINTGGTGTNYAGEDFIADQYFNTGNILDRPQTGLPEPFQTFRFSRSQQMSYDIPVPDGEYTVNLYFAELWFGATAGGSGGVGSRVFDVSMEGQLVEDNLDIFAEVGADAMLVKTHTVTVFGGVLDLDFDSRDIVGGERHPVVNAIEILGVVSEPEERPFVTTWKTDNPGTSEDNQISIPTHPNEVYDYTIDWGDGSSDSGITGSITHTFAIAGTYQVSISGIFPSIFFNDPFNNQSGDADKILSIDQWGDIVWNYVAVAYAGCDNLDMKATDVPDFSNIIYTNAMFLGCAALVGNDTMNSWDFSSVISMNSMFSNATSFNQDIGQWNLGNVTDFGLMLSSASSFNQDIGSWDVTEAVNMNGMFAGANSFDQDISAWNVSKAEDLSGMFNGVILSTENYDGLLKGWSTRQLQNGLLFDAGNSQYCEGEEARQKLIDDFGWTITDAGKATDCAIPTIDEFWLEAECANLGANWSVINNAGASGGQYLLPPVGANYNSAPTDPNSVVTFDLVAEAGNYKIYVRVSVPSEEDDSFWVRVNGGTWLRWNLIPGSANFGWHQIHDRELNTSFLSFDLIDGINTIEIGHREDGAGLDKLYVTRTSNVPTGFGEIDETCNSNISGRRAITSTAILSPNPVVTATTTLSFEKPVELTNIQIFDALGRLVHSYNGPEVADEGAYILQVNNLKSGTYFINSVDTQGVKHQKQMVIKK